MHTQGNNSVLINAKYTRAEKQIFNKQTITTSDETIIDGNDDGETKATSVNFKIRNRDIGRREAKFFATIISTNAYETEKQSEASERASEFIERKDATHQMIMHNSVQTLIGQSSLSATMEQRVVDSETISLFFYNHLLCTSFFLSPTPPKASRS